MNIQVTGGKMRDSTVHHATAFIPDLAADVPVIKIEGEAAGKARDLNEFIALSVLKAINLKGSNKKSESFKITDGDAATVFYP